MVRGPRAVRATLAAVAGAALLLLAAGPLRAEDEPRQLEYCNPLPVLLADPHVLYHEGTYYLYATSTADRGYLVWTSANLVNWHLAGAVVLRTDTSWGQGDFWAPEVVEHRGKFLLHYTSRGPQGRRLCVAQADSPLGPFTDVRAPMFDHGTSDIDGHVYRARDGSEWLFYVVEFPNRVFVAPLSADLTRLAGKPTLCLAPNQPWEGGVNEGPCVVERGGTLHLLYSGQGFDNPNYSVGCATATSPQGPWRKGSGPILGRTGAVSGPGHNCVVRSPDGKELFLVYHTQQQVGGGARQLALDRVFWDEGPDGQTALRAHGPTRTPQPVPSGASPFPVARNDEFDGPELDRSRWTIFQEDASRWSLHDGAVVVRTADGDLWKGRADMTNVFLQQAPPGDFAFSVHARFAPGQNYEQAALLAMQDHNNYVRLSWAFVDGPKLEMGVEVEGMYRAAVVDAPSGDELWLRMEKKGTRWTFATSPDGRAWQTVGGPLEASLQGLKVGFGAAAPHSGRALDARFDHFRVERAPASASALALRARASASHVWFLDTVAALHDGLEPAESADRSLPRMTWWDRRGTSEWVQYDFDRPETLAAVEVYWYDDRRFDDGYCRVPQSWEVLSRDSAGRWRPIASRSGYGRELGRFNRATFAPMTTRSLRLRVQLQRGFSGGVLEWRVLGP